ncbi:MAG TPA: transposase [Terriglobales bacterium]|nr:transposase [Terriglobales bacterium]
MPDTPLAYLITFRCYGTWLHGDERGSIDRHRNQYNSEYIIANPNWHEYNVRHLKFAPVKLTDIQRQSVEAAIHETCQFRSWELKAINVRSNHVHTVVSTGSLRPERVLNALKANSTRQLRQDGRWLHSHTPWADSGSKRYVWTDVGSSVLFSTWLAVKMVPFRNSIHHLLVFRDLALGRNR